MDALRRWAGAHLGSPSEPPDTRILFVHIPKTAGMSLYHALRRWASPQRSLRFPNGGQADLDAWLALPQERIDDLRLISGHLPVHVFRRRDLTGWLPITLLRDPVARTLSTYSYMRDQRSHPWHRLVSAMSLEQFLDWFDERPANHDQQCGFVDRSRTAEAAFRVLSEEFHLAATVERLDDFDEALSELLGTPIRTPVRNRSRRSIDAATLSEGTLARIRDMQREDEALYKRLREAGLVGTFSGGD